MRWFSALIGLFLIVGCQNGSEAPVSPFENNALLTGNHMSSASQVPNLQKDLAALAAASASAQAKAKVDLSQSTANEEVTKTFHLGQNSSAEINVRVKVKVKVKTKIVTRRTEEVPTKTEEVLEQPCETCQEKVAEESCNECQEETPTEKTMEEECPCGYETEHQTEWIPPDEKQDEHEVEFYEDCQEESYQAHAEASASSDSCQCECHCEATYHAGLSN